MIKHMAIIIPTRERAPKIVKLHEQWFKVTNPYVSTDCIIVLDSDNESTYERLPGFIYHVVYTDGKRGVVTPLNNVATKIYNNYQYVGFWGDDHFPHTQDWNVMMYDTLHKNKPFSMVYGNDLLQGSRLCTEIIMDSNYISQLGYMAHPEFTHLFIDDVWMYMGKRKNNIHYLDNVIIEHLHYTNQKSEVDDLYLINNTDTVSYDIFKRVTESQEFNESLDNLHILEENKN